MATLQNRLKQLREEAGLKQKDIAPKLNISTSAYGFYEQNKRTPDANMLVDLAKIFDVSLDYLMGLSDDKKTDGNSFSLEHSTDISIYLENLKEQIKQEEQILYKREIVDSTTKELLLQSLKFQESLLKAQQNKLE